MLARRAREPNRRAQNPATVMPVFQCSDGHRHMWDAEIPIVTDANFAEVIGRQSALPETIRFRFAEDAAREEGKPRPVLFYVRSN